MVASSDRIHRDVDIALFGSHHCWATTVLANGATEMNGLNEAACVTMKEAAN